jgi:hypothetical protein
MKIKSEYQLGIMFKSLPNFKKAIMEKHMNPEQFAIKTPEFIVERQAIINSLIDDTKFKDYLITETAKEIANKIKVGTGFNYKLLNTIKEQSSTYLLGKNRFVRFEVKGDNIYVLHVDYNWDTSWLNYEMFRINTKDGLIYGVSDTCRDIAEELTKYLIFVNLSDVELKILPPNRKVGTRQTGYKNETIFNITVVDSNWNKFIIRTESFTVTGHLRLQAYGKNYSLRKLVWIVPYEKHGYIRLPKNVKE